MSNTSRHDLYSTADLHGITFNRTRNKWLVRVSEHGKRRSLGSFDTQQEAIGARNAYRKNPTILATPDPDAVVASAFEVIATIGLHTDYDSKHEYKRAICKHLGITQQ